MSKRRIVHILTIVLFALAALAAFGYALGYFDITFITR